jgi:uncharacterized membrane protein YeaQ/YmgE (transglycosylase-associated protein family)
VLGFVVVMIIVGAIAGYIGRLLVAGPDPMGFWQTTLLGIAGSFVGGTLGSLLFHGRLVIAPGGLLLALPGTVIALLVYRRIAFGSIMPPRPR